MTQLCSSSRRYFRTIQEAVKRTNICHRKSQLPATSRQLEHSVSFPERSMKQPGRYQRQPGQGRCLGAGVGEPLITVRRYSSLPTCTTVMTTRQPSRPQCRQQSSAFFCVLCAIDDETRRHRAVCLRRQITVCLPEQMQTTHRCFAS